MSVKTLKWVTFLCLAVVVTCVRRNVFEKTPRGLVDPKYCVRDHQRICYSCENAALCVNSTGGMTAYAEPCNTFTFTEVCNIAADADNAECTSTPADNEPGAECFCNPSLPQPRYQPDAYTQNAYIYCNNDITYYYECLNDYIYSSDLETCVPIAPTCKYLGIFPFEDDCYFYYICTKVGSQGDIEMCDQGQFFDVNVGRCTVIPSSGNRCQYDDGEPVTGTVGDPIYCNYYYVCDKGTIITFGTCESGTIFSEEAQKCITDDGSCITTAYCFG